MARPVVDLQGKRFGKLVVIRKRDDLKKKGENAKWECRCDCGNTIITNSGQLVAGRKTNCGSPKCQKFNSGKFAKGQGIKDITGQKFGKLTVLRLDRVVNRKSYWVVQCECGTIKSARSDTLKVITSCGCDKRKQDLINFHITNHHELTYHPVYRIWNAMLNRCEHKSNHAYKDYGGRGIKVCEEWHDLKKFAKWADENGFEPNKNLSIERIDVNGNYCPENCCWINRRLQTRNRRNTIRFAINGEEKPLAEWAEIYGANYRTVIGRYRNGKRKPEDLFYRGNLQKRDLRRVLVNGEHLTAREIAQKYGVNISSINARIDRGIIDEKLLLHKGNLKELK